MFLNLKVFFLHMLNKKASAAAVIVVVILVIIVLFWIGKSLMKECRKDTDCGSGYYCGSDFKCHQMKTIEKTIIKNDFNRAAYLIAFAIIIAAIILRLKPKKLNLRNIIEKNPPANYSSPYTNEEFR